MSGGREKKFADALEQIEDLCHYQSGPTGPLTKNLGRTAVCQKEAGCTVQTSL